MTDPFRAYYRTHLPDLSCITTTPFRHFRFVLPSGRFLKVNDRITSPEVLRRWLVRHRPLDAYYSVACWLSPEQLGRRERTPLSANIFLGSDIAFDIDRSPFSVENLELARRETQKLVAWCDRQHLPVKYIAFSGSKGFHVICSDPNRYPGSDPQKREDRAREYRRSLTGNICAAGITCDTAITTDTRRIIRVPGTINSRSGYACTVIPRAMLEWPVTEILKSVPHIALSAPLIPSWGDELRLRLVRMIQRPFHRFGVRWGPDISFSSYLSSHVPGTRLQVPFFEYPSHRRKDRIRSELATLQGIYGLSDIHLFADPKAIQCVCFRSYPLRRLEKILAASTSANRNVLLKYHQLFFRIGPARNERQREAIPAPRYLETVPACDRNNRQYVSRPHREFFSRYGIPYREYEREHGAGNLTVTHAVIER